VHGGEQTLSAVSVVDSAAMPPARAIQELVQAWNDAINATVLRAAYLCYASQ
jgi:hypothetical protein